MNKKREAFVWMEILVAVSASVFISLAGMRTLSLFLDRYAKQQAAEVEEQEIYRLGQRLQRQFDQRMESPFSDQPRLAIEGLPVGGRLSLSSIHLRFHPYHGKPATWKLERADGRWSESMQFSDGSESEVRQLQYDEDILVLRRPVEQGMPHEVMIWTFPGCTGRLAQEGFAIFAFW